jgi:hypothetical protein
MATKKILTDLSIQGSLTLSPENNIKLSNSSWLSGRNVADDYHVLLIGLDANNVVKIDPNFFGTLISGNATVGNDLTVNGELSVTQAATFASTVAALGGNSTQWNTAYGWGNHADAGYSTTSELGSYVTVAGSQTVTGQKTFNTGSYNPLKLDRTGFTNVNMSFNHGGVLKGYLGVGDGGTLTWGSNANSDVNALIYHSGNIPTWNQSTTGNALTSTSAGKVQSGGTTDLNTAANSVVAGELIHNSFSGSALNKPPTGDNANSVITVGQHSGNYNAQLAFSSTGNIYWRDNPSTSFGSWKTVWDSSNLTNNTQLANGAGYSTHNFGTTDLTFEGADPGDLVWRNASAVETHRIWAGSSTMNYRTDAGTTYQLWHTGNLTNNTQLTNGAGYTGDQDLSGLMPKQFATTYRIIPSGGWSGYNLGSGTMSQSTSAGLPSGATHGYWFNLGRRDSGGGYVGIYVNNYQNGGSGVYIGRGELSATDPTWEKVWTNLTDGINSGLDADLLRGKSSTSGSTADTVVLRNTSGDISTRLFRSEYDTTNPSIGYIMTQIDTGSNNYIRPSTPAQFRAAVTDNYYNNITNNDQISNGAGYITSASMNDNAAQITVGGDADTYYPVRINGGGTYGFHNYSISRRYNDPGPDTWHTASHKGGLTLTFQWSGDTAWGGNHKTIRVVEFGESYSTMVGGLALPKTGGVMVWLRGGGARYDLHTPDGKSVSAVIEYSGYTDGSGDVYPTRTTPVNTEITDRWPVRRTSQIDVSTANVFNLTVGNDFRAPIFLDSDNTGYYLNPASTSNLNAVNANRLSVGNNETITLGDDSATHTYNPGSGRSRLYVTSQYPVITINSDASTNTNHGPTLQFTHNGGDSNRQWVLGSGGTGQQLDFGTAQPSNKNPHAGIAGYDGTTLMRMTVAGNVGIGGDWGYQGVIENPSYPLHVQGTAASTGDFRAPMFYDSNNTAYYIHADNHSYLNTLALGGSSLGFINKDRDAEIRVTDDNFNGTGAEFVFYGDLVAGNAQLTAEVGNFSRQLRTEQLIDSSDTNYYINPNSDSNLYRGKFRANDQVDNNYTLAALWTQNYNNGPAGIAFHISGNVGKLLEMRTNGVLYWNNTEVLTTSSGYLPLSGGTLTGDITVGSGKNSSNIYMADSDGTARRIHTNSNRIGFLTSGNGWGSYCTNNGDWTTDMISYAGASMRAPIFYDSNNTGYRVDPASTSNLNALTLLGLTVNGAGYFSSQLTIDGFGNNQGLSFRSGYSPTNVGIRAKAITTSNRDGIEILGYNGIDLTINGENTVALRVTGQSNANPGRVGIGTISPGEKLEVAGNVKAQGYKSSDGTAGITGTMTFTDQDSVTRTITYKNGLVVGTTPTPQ